MERHFDDRQGPGHENAVPESQESAHSRRDPGASLDEGEDNKRELCQRIKKFTFNIELWIIMFVSQDRDKLQRQHLNDTVEELRRFNARRKLKSAVLAVAGGISMDPQYGADSDSSKFGTDLEGVRGVYA